MKFCTHVYLDNFWNYVEFQGHRSKVGFLVFFLSASAATRGQYLALCKARRSYFVVISSPTCERPNRQ